MKPLPKTLLGLAFVAWLLYKGVTGLLHPNPDLPLIWPYSFLLLAVLCIFGAVKDYRRTGELFPTRPAEPAEPLTRPERILVKAAGSFLILVGLIFLGMGAWLAWDQYDSVAQARRTEALLSRLGAKSSEHDSYRELVKAEEGAALFGLAFLFGGVWVSRTPRSLL